VSRRPLTREPPDGVNDTDRLRVGGSAGWRNRGGIPGNRNVGRGTTCARGADTRHASSRSWPLVPSSGSRDHDHLTDSCEW